MIKQLPIFRDLKDNILRWIEIKSGALHMTGLGINVGKNRDSDRMGRKDIENGKKESVLITNVQTLYLHR